MALVTMTCTYKGAFTHHVRLRMYFQHFNVFWKNLRWFIFMYVYGNKRKYIQNATQCGKRMDKPDVATRLKVDPS